MECFIVRPEDVDESQHTLILRGDEAHHATKSLRLRTGDALLATNLIGLCYQCRVVGAAAGILDCIIEEILPNFGESSRNITLIQGIVAQPARWEFLVEKATELGVTSIVPVITERTERAKINLERTDRIVDAAVKQTKRSKKPKIVLDESGSLLDFNSALQHANDEGCTLILLHESGYDRPLLNDVISERNSADNTRNEVAPITIVVGPEGGFSDEEVAHAREHGAIVASLGLRRLRAETAAIAALALVVE